MARDWRDLFIVDGAPPPEAATESGGEERRRGMFRRLRENMRKTRQALTSEIQATLFEDLDEHTWERLEEALIYADVGAQTTANVVEQLELEATGGEITGGEALSRMVVLAAGDTFRAAGVEQLELWAQRAGVRFVKGAPDADPGSVAYDAIATGRRDGADVVIVDTAG